MLAQGFHRTHKRRTLLGIGTVEDLLDQRALDTEFAFLVFLRRIFSALVCPPNIGVTTPTINVAHDMLAGRQSAMFARTNVDVDNVLEKVGMTSATAEVF